MAKVKVNVPYVPKKDWNGEYLIISSYKPDRFEVENYNAKRKYIVHAVYGTGSEFLGRFFNLHKARETVLMY